MDIPRIKHGYTSIDIPCISMYIRGIYMMDIHGLCDGYLCIYHVYPPRWIYIVYPWISEYIPWISNHYYRSGRHIHGIYMEYSMYIHEIGVPDVATAVNLASPSEY